MTLRPAVVVLLICCAMCPLRAAVPAGKDLSLQFVRTESIERIEVRGLAPDLLQSLQATADSRKLLADLVTVRVVDGDKLLPEMLGRTFIEGRTLVFLPKFPLRQQVSYQATFRLSRLDAGRQDLLTVRAAVVDAGKPRHQVTAVYPSGSTLPENTLRFYVHFSGPMSRGEAYRRVRLFHADGRQVMFPFLELAEELWDPTGTRFTLYFDPGRIKRGLEPRERFGPALEAGKKYTLVISNEWSDARGAPLLSEYRKSFSVVEPDQKQPDPGRWKISTPSAGKGTPLVVRLDEPLDHAMLLRVVSVVRIDGREIAGEAEVADGERTWRFTPVSPWNEGEYFLSVDMDLEDHAGNSIARPFEIDVFDKVERRIEREYVRIPFVVSR